MLGQKVIVIVGGTSGIGLSAALAFQLQGASLILVGKDAQSCDEANEKTGGKATVLHADATLENTATFAINKAVEMYGKLDGLYHVAGGSGRKFGDGPVHEMSLEAWNKTFELNLSSIMFSNKAVINQFKKQNTGGSILNLGSVLGFSPSPEYFVTHAYAAAKAAMIGFTKSLAAHYAKDNIRVNLLAPGLVETPMSLRAANNKEIMSFIKTKQPLDGGRIGKPEDLDGAAIYFMSDASRFTTGQVLSVDGGWTVSEGQITG